MKALLGKSKSVLMVAAAVCLLTTMSISVSSARDLNDIKKDGVLRHLGVVHANFVTPDGQGLDVELMQLFAKHLGVKYEHVDTTFGTCIADLTGKNVKAKGDDIEVLGDAPVKGDVIANGLTELPWREKVVDYSEPTFPTQVWLMAKKGTIKPLNLTGNVEKDITMVKKALQGLSVLTKEKTCLAPALYKLDKTGAKLKQFDNGLQMMAGEVMAGNADATILDVPDALVALNTWPGKIEVIGPVSELQNMGVGFAKDAPKLRAEFNKFFEELKKSGAYKKMVKKYYPAVFSFYPDFFKAKNN